MGFVLLSLQYCERVNADPYCSAGGPKAWKEMQQRQMEFYQGFDQDSTAKANASDEDFEAEYSQDVKAHLEDGGQRKDSDGNPEDEDELVSVCPALWLDRSG